MLCTVLTGTLLICAVSLIYLSIYQHAGDEAEAAMSGSDTVSVSRVDGGYLFDGPSDSRAIIFYQGAKVECRAYAPLMLRLAESGFDCFLADMPFNFAVFGSDIADKFVGSYQYDTWIMAGHSMGGIMAASYAGAHTDRIAGIVLLAAYPSETVDNCQKLCSVYGSRDGVLNREQYEADRAYWPVGSAEFIIQGGNHAQFGDYGFQSGDNPADITAYEQQSQTVDAVTGFFE
ncbi:MAG: alpha/beta fold hydrolase [Lachnospiraceae bacterium]|nr:alpha/beta fold hydrolase [Lachnospiraceae bacterium]